MYLEPLQAANAIYCNNMRPPPCLARGGLLTFFPKLRHPEKVPFPTYPKNPPGDEFTAQQNHPPGA